MIFKFLIGLIVTRLFFITGILSSSKDLNFEINIDIKNSGSNFNRGLLKLIFKASFNSENFDDKKSKLIGNKIESQNSSNNNIDDERKLQISENKNLTNHNGVNEIELKSLHNNCSKNNSSNIIKNENLEQLIEPQINNNSNETHLNLNSIQNLTYVSSLLNVKNSTNFELKSSTSEQISGRKCPNEFQLYNEHNDRCYFVSNIKNSWNSALKDCINKNATLVSINGLEEFDILMNIIVDMGEDNIWIGATYNALKGEWYWTDGSSFELDSSWNCEDHSSYELGNGYCLTITKQKPSDMICNSNDFCQENFNYVCQADSILK